MSRYAAIEVQISLGMAPRTSTMVHMVAQESWKPRLSKMDSYVHIMMALVATGKEFTSVNWSCRIILETIGAPAQYLSPAGLENVLVRKP